ncbi:MULTISPECIES: hypothetical protein [unclassified Acinetobacter]|uniref:hypothetical protein n=1 Tax=unclassified Acinetobacter TaxID=196816 RepID=UPI00190A71F8|nr:MULTISPECIES: hypothetical protein [unclassified Acinetobacter]MBK0063463.1 hypothetical protein [Acinetobacter sp. S55]MBK0065466.1 hypothetical protein [Acinetobacter sp. S54]
MKYIVRKKEIYIIFNELVAKYSQAMNEIIADPQDRRIIDLIYELHTVEDFLNDLQFIKGDLFRCTKKHIGTHISYATNDFEPSFKIIPSIYARKLYPFSPLFFDLEKYNEKSLRDFSMTLYLFIETLKKYEKPKGKMSIVDTIFQSNSLSNYVKFDFLKINFYRMKIDNYEESYARLLNSIVYDFKFNLKFNSRKINENNTKYRKRKSEYEIYVDQIISEYGKISAISLDFWCEDDKDLNIGDLKTSFLNNIRSLSVFYCVKGYVGNWDFNVERGLYFRCIFFISNNGFYDVGVVQEELKNYWEQGLFYNSEKIFPKHLLRYADSSFLAYSSKKLTTSVITSHEKGSKRFIDEFYDIVLNYIVVSEKYFYPAILRSSLLHATSKIYEQEMPLNEKLLLDKYGASRSFRGHIRKSHAEKLTLAHPSKEDVRDSG